MEPSDWFSSVARRWHVARLAVSRVSIVSNVHCDGSIITLGDMSHTRDVTNFISTASPDVATCVALRAWFWKQEKLAGTPTTTITTTTRSLCLLTICITGWSRCCRLSTLFSHSHFISLPFPSCGLRCAFSFSLLALPFLDSLRGRLINAIPRLTN